MMNAVITDASKPAIATPTLGAVPSAAHDDGAETEALDLETEPLPHVVVLHYVDLVGNLSVPQRLREISHLSRCESVKVLFHLLLAWLLLLSRRGLRGLVVMERKRTPVGPEQDGGRGDMDDDNSITRAKVIVNGPADGKGTLVRKVDGDADLAAGAGGGSRSSSGGRCGGVMGVARGGWVVDLDGGELRVVSVLAWRIHFRSARRKRNNYATRSRDNLENQDCLVFTLFFDYLR